MRRSAVVVIAALGAALIGCGRLGFDAIETGVGPDAPIGPPPGPDADPSTYVISATQVTTAAGNTLVDLEVDWMNGVAYIGTREAGVCFMAVDLVTTPPSVIATRGPPDTGGATCLGVHLDGTAQLLVASEGGGVVELWDLGNDPRAASYARLASVPVPRPRRIGSDTNLNAVHYVARGSTAPGVQVVITAPAPPYLTLGDTYDAPPCPNSYNDAAHLQSGYVITGCSEDHSPVELISDTTLIQTDTISADNGGLSGFWSAARNGDGSVVALGGWVSATVVRDSATPYWRLLALWDNESGYRGVMINDALLWASTSDGHIEVLTLDQASPRVVRRAPLGVPGEAYAIEVSPDGTRAIVVTNGGYVVIVDAAKLPVTDFVWPGLP